MGLQNKKTREIVREETKDYWYLNGLGYVIRAVYKPDDLTRDLIAIGNHFETPEEAEKAVEKLKAWKRLKDRGFKFELRPGIARGEIRYYVTEESNEVEQDLQICFGGEE